MTLDTWKSALAGFLICAGFTVLLYLWLHVAAVGVAEALQAYLAKTSDKPEFPQWLVEDSRWRARETSTLLLSAFALYWLMSALLGKGRVTSIRSANALLLLATGCGLAVGLNGFYGWAETYCDQLPYSHQGFQITKIHECPSSWMFFRGLAIAFLLLMLASLVTRIIMSRKKPTAT